MNSKKFYANRYHPQRNLSKANIKLYNTIIDLDIDSVFEFGCGVGRHLERLNKWGYKTKGVDISSKCVEEAILNGLDVIEGDETILKDITPHDLVFTNSVLCHIEDVDTALEQLKRIAKKYLIQFECVTKTNKHWYIHDYLGEEILTIDSHLNNGATYKLYLCEF